MKHLSLIYGLWLVVVSSLAIQGASAMDGVDRARQAWVVATEMPKDVPNPLPIYSDKNLHQVAMHQRLVHQPVPVDETGIVRVVKPEIGGDGKVKYTNLAVAQLGKPVRKALIVLVPDHNEGLAFRAEVIDLAEFKGGGCLFVNQVKTSVGITLGEHKSVVKPGELEFINALGGERKKVFPVQFFYEVPQHQDSEWRLMTASKLALFDTRREINIFFFNPQSNNVEFRGISFPTPMPKLVQHDR